MTLHVSGSLSAHHQEFLAAHQLWNIWCSFDDHMLPGVGWNHPTPGSIWSSKLHQMYQSWCTAKNWWWAERLPKTRSRNTNKIGFQCKFVLFTRNLLWCTVIWS